MYEDAKAFLYLVRSGVDITCATDFDALNVATSEAYEALRELITEATAKINEQKYGVEREATRERIIQARGGI